MTLIDKIFLGILIAVATASSCLVLAEFFLRNTMLDHTRKMERAREYWRHLIEDDDSLVWKKMDGVTVWQRVREDEDDGLSSDK